MKVVALNVGLPGVIEHQGRPVPSAICKESVAGPTYLTSLNFVGDWQADQVHHGGPEKAVCVYPFEHYAYWEAELGRPLPPAAFGENLTLSGLTEESVCIGDRYQIGTATVQVCQPRIPCFKLAARLGVPNMVERVLAVGYSGYYLRVLAEGEVAAGDSVTLLSRGAGEVTIAEANRVRRKRRDLEGARRLLGAEGLAAEWHSWVSRILPST